MSRALDQTDKESHTSDRGSVREAESLSFGLVAWLDVLGFKQLLSANEDKAHVWVDVLKFLRSSQEIQEAHQPTKFQKIHVGLRPQDYKFTAFADTIVTSVDLSQATLDKSKEWHWIMLFLMRNAYLCRKMFEYGLPTRGGISIGKFYHAELGFAGRPFVAAECLSSKLELSACVFDDACVSHLRTVFENKLNDLDSNPHWFRYNTPMKGESVTSAPVIQDRRILNITSRGSLGSPVASNSYKIDFSCADLNQVVLDSFTAHGKSVENETVKVKISNTVDMFEQRRASAELFH